MSLASKIAENLSYIGERIALSALRSGRDPNDVELVAVSKTFPSKAIVAAYEVGQHHFGENRPEEGAEKIPLVVDSLAGNSLVWHMIGHIQSRKAHLVVTHFDIVHSIDRMSIATKLSVLAKQANRTLPVLLECNVSGEKSKYGFDATGWEQDDAIRLNLFDTVSVISNLPGLDVKGLMTMAPLVENAEEVRPVFVSLRSLRDELNVHFQDADFTQLSMGMSNDFEVAVEEGATMVRIGRAIFGQRT